MNRRLTGGLLSALGILLVIGGLVLMLAIVPGLKKMPDDTDVTRTYQGTMNVTLNPQTFQFMNDLPIEVVRHFKVDAVDGNVALVKEERSMTSGGQPLQQIVSNYAVDRKTMMATDSFPSSWKGKEGFWPREGIVLSWPIGTEKKDYTGWSDDYRATVTLKFEGEVTHERSGMKTYLFKSSSGPKPIVAEQVKVMGLPMELPKAQLAALIGQADLGALGALVKDQLPQLLAAWAQLTVPLEYYYEYEGEYWIDPTTGVMIDTKKHELRKVGLGETFISQTPLAMLPEAQRAALRVAVSDFEYLTTDKSVQDAKDSAKDTGGKLKLFGTTLPIVLIIVGLVLGAGGGFLGIRKTS